MRTTLGSWFSNGHGRAAKSQVQAMVDGEDHQLTAAVAGPGVGDQGQGEGVSAAG